MEEIELTHRILVVEQHKATQTTLTKILQKEKYHVDTVFDRQAALEILASEEYAVMILDSVFSSMDGIDVLQKAVEISCDTKIILLDGHGSLEAVIEAIRCRAHDYLLVPYEIQELLSSVANALARYDQEKYKRLLLEQLESSLQQLKDVEGISASPKSQRPVVSLPDGVSLDLIRREMWRGEDRARLTPTEGKLLEIFVTNRDRVMSHGDLVFLVQGYEVEEWEAPEILRPLISRLRRKLAVFPQGEKWIASVRGKGYIFKGES